MDLSDAEQLAKRLIASHLGPDWNFRWDHAKTRLGACHHESRTISLSQHYVGLNGAAETTDTVLHEIAHALTPGSGHGPSWKRVAVQLGARPSPRADSRNLVLPPPQWVAVCSACAATIWRYRRPTATMACARCCRRHNGGRFDASFLLRWRPAEKAAPGATRDSASRDTASRDTASRDTASRDPARRPAARAAWKTPVTPPDQLELFAHPGD